ncbi:MAG: Divalent-cation tolerance protein CutA [Chlamydiales bacterium]|nr:Divalent-cation tolerance protein CutA [Chlamydiales bacterium]MCH9619869.1 Divalent-cation tolerance protein CutA [Chlamydiales bacterium]MCH9622704.1 Divalent-cation tolerance protein CutA [Chlamydiales bacterium]
MDHYIQIHWTCGSIDEARAVAKLLVEKQLVACANIIPWVESIYSWDDQIDVTQESKVIFKTRQNLFEKVKTFILQHAKYEVPEILELPITSGNESYLRWLDESLEKKV